MQNVTAIIHTFLRDDYLFDCVKSLRDHYPDMHVVVSDDGHHSNVKERWLRDLGVEKYIRLPWNSGLCAGRNALLRECTTPYFLLGDDDFTYTPASNLDYLLPLMEIADIAGGGIIEDGKLLHYEYNLRRIAKCIRGFDIDPSSKQEYKGVSYFPAGMTFNFFMGRADSVRKVGWDERYKIRYEHEDFFMMALQNELGVVYCPDVTAFHKAQKYPVSTEYTNYRWPKEDWTAFNQKWGYNWL